MRASRAESREETNTQVEIADELGGGWQLGNQGPAFHSEEEGEVHLGESLDDGDARGRRFPLLGALCFLSLSHLPQWVRTLSFLDVR